MVPEGWTESKLRDLLDRVIDYRGISVPKSPSGIPLITARNVKKGWLDLSEKEFIDESAYEQWMKRGTPGPGDILFTTEAPLGNVCRFPSGGKFAMAQRTVALRANERAAPEFIFQFLLSEIGQHTIQLKSSGSTAKGIKSSELKKIPLIHPRCRDEQNHIGQILLTWDKAISTTERLLASSEKQKEALMQQLLTGKKRLPRFNGEWKSHRLGELFKERTENGFTDLPLLSITSDAGVIPRGDVGRRDTSNDDKSKYLRICPGDIGYNTMRMWQGVSALSAFEGIVSPAYTILKPTDDVHPPFAAYLFKLPRLVHEFYRHSQGLVSDTWNLKYRHFAEIEWAFPNKPEQEAIAKVLTAADSEITGIKKQLVRLRDEKKALMQQLLTGKRRVKERFTVSEVSHA